jgi:hypothetical protein
MTIVGAFVCCNGLLGGDCATIYERVLYLHEDRRICSAVAQLHVLAANANSRYCAILPIVI